MKVLFTVPYIYDKQYPEFTKNSTGFGMLMTQIYEYISKENEAYLISYVFTKGHGNILPHTVGGMLRHVHFRDVVQGIKWALKYKQGIGGRLRYFYYCLNKGYARDVIKRIRPDVVHINAVTMSSRPFIEICEEMDIKYVVTLHGLIGLKNSGKSPKWDKEYEKKVLLRCEEKNIPVTVISTGIKNRIEKYYLGKPSCSITVVTNGTDVIPADGELFGDLREKHQIPKNGKIAVSVGNLCDRKNQIQIVEAVSELLQKHGQELYIFFCGRDGLDGKIQQRIDQLGLNSHVFVLGFLSSEQLRSIYRQADFNILASVDEGFGLGIIEAFVYGLPTVTFADLDAIPDLYDEAAMLLCNNRSTEAFADTILETMGKAWDKDQIMKYSKKFSLEKMAENYLRVYEKTAN